MKKVFQIFLFFLFFSCSAGYHSPEEVVRTWQDHMDKNDFEAAKKLSTPETRVMLDSIEAFLTKDQEPIPIDTTEFITLNCQEKGSNAICKYTVKLKEELIELGGGRGILRLEEEILGDSFLLKKINGKWLVLLEE